MYLIWIEKRGRETSNVGYNTGKSLQAVCRSEWRREKELNAATKRKLCAENT